MKIISIIITTAAVLVLAVSCFSNAYAQTAQTEPKAPEAPQQITAKQPAPEKSKPRMSFVKMADFYLRDGRFVFGRLVSEDKNKIIVEQPGAGKVVVSTYSKKDVDTRTLDIKRLPEHKYYLDLGDYFYSRTWDFTDDTDDFIQAIRSFEKAKELIARTREPSSEKIGQINERIERLAADREVWIKEVESRARLRKLEFEAEIEKRIKALEENVNANNRQLDESIEQLDKIVEEMEYNYNRLREATEESISGISDTLSGQLRILEDRIETNRRLIDRIERRRRLYRRHYGPYQSIPNSNQQPQP